MKTLKLAILATAFAWSVALFAQTPTLSCRPLDPGGNTFLQPDEKVIGDQVCKIVAVTARAPQRTAQPSPAPTSTPTIAQSEPSTPAVVSHAPAPVASAVPEDAPDSVPTEAGMYVETAGRLTKILGQIVEFTRTGSLLVSHLTYGIKAAKGNAQLLGPHAQTITGASPEFYFIPAKQEADSGVNAGDLILIRLEEKKNRRQFEVGAQGDWRASKGISLTHQIQLARSEVRPGVYKIVPGIELGRGEYGLYLARGEGLAPYIYDFSVQ
jgi:hypothetical protein